MMTKPASLFLISAAIGLFAPPQLCWSWTFSSSPQSSTKKSASIIQRQEKNSIAVSRRHALTTGITAAATLTSGLWVPFSPALADDDDAPPPQPPVVYTKYETRDRNSNKNAIIREDYWYTTGVAPPRKLNSPLVLDDPKWNAFGSCTTTGENAGGTNSCTYISLKQRQPAYSKYGFTIAQGARDFQQLKTILQQQDWKLAANLVVTSPDTRDLPPPTVDALLKMVLFASSMLTSPNFSGPARELLVARFYANEYKFALDELSDAILARDLPRAQAAWDFGKDSFNSYAQVVNRQIVPKVGDPFSFIE